MDRARSRRQASGKAGADPSIFWERVDQSAGPDACWPWLGGRAAAGYGSIRWSIGGESKSYYAHRVAFFLTHGELPDPAIAPLLRHSCDNRPCCNPHHLLPGTDADNIADAMARGRHSKPPTGKGENNSNAKLCEAQVAEIKRALRAGRLHSELAEEFRTTFSNISAIKRDRAWSHVPWPNEISA